MKAAATKRFENAAPGEAAKDVARRAVEKRLRAVERAASVAAHASGDNIEPVHDLRIATRRAEAALRLYGEFMPRRRQRKLKRMLGRLRRAAGDARDDDVLLGRLEKSFRQAGRSRLLAKIRRHRRRAQKPLEQLHERLFDEPRYRRRVKKALKDMGASRRGSPSNFGDWARLRFARALGQIVASGEGDLSQAEDLHRFRVRGKRLRYAVELLAGAFPIDELKAFYVRLTDVQDRLGDINDRRNGVGRLAALSESAEGDDRNFLERWVKVERQRVAALHDDFLKGWLAGEREALWRMGRELTGS